MTTALLLIAHGSRHADANVKAMSWEAKGGSAVSRPEEPWKPGMSPW